MGICVSFLVPIFHNLANLSSHREEADSFHFLAARDEVPLKSEFKPAVKVLSRKPTPKLISRNEPLTGESQLMLEDFRDEGDEGLRSNTLSPEEMRLKAQREREEKQRRYEEARKRLFGSASISPAPGSTSGSRDTQKPQVLNKPPESRDIRARGRCKGTRSSPVLPDRNEHQYGYEARGGTHSDARNKRELYDPQLESKPDFTPTLEQASYDSQQPKQERTAEPTIREPRQPKQSARGFDTLLQDKAV